MKHITPDLIKELRSKTGSGFMDCKAALLLSSGNIEEAIINLRKNGKIKAKKKHKNIAMKGIVLSSIKKSVGCIIELNCETDFVAQHDEFIDFAKEILSQAHIQGIQDLEDLKKYFDEQRMILISKFNENIIIRRFFVIEGHTLLSYMHGFRIGVLLSIQSSNRIVAKKIAMHIAASKPEYIDIESIPVELINKEREIQLEIALNSGKNKKISKKIVTGKVNKFINEITLLEQDFVVNPEKKVKTFLNENNIKILNFVRFEVGEIIS